ncbi:flippase [Candidatus Enterococcus mansonii]|uniref:Membrane protein n=1 Tax=Candidatus Enterococcus mansonii TaxID=1834181 RepID=A0A242CHR2_9ENTE|nr:flippase [Enterococcus sp. 4G2_DIV0659]OTO09751.1 membrane protein [Enterococcus sp. 4G2_DIV0659]
MRSLIKNFFSNATYQIFTIVFPLLTMPYIARVLGAEQMGIFNYTYAIAIYFALVVKLGADHYGNRSIAKVGKDIKDRSEIFWEIFGVQFFNGIICIIAYLIFVTAFVTENQTVAYLQVFLIISFALDINWFFYGIEQFNIVILRNTLVKIFTVACVFLFVKSINDVWIYTIIMNVGSIVGFLITWIQLRKFVEFRAVSIKKILPHIKPSLVLFIPIVSASIFTSFTTVLLGQMTNMSNVGFYDAGSKILAMPKGVIAALGTVMLPKMSAAYANPETKKEAGKYLNVSIIFASFLAIVFTFGLISISKDFIPLFYGNDFSASINVLNILAIYIPFYALGNVIRTQFLIPQAKDRPFVISVLLGAVASIIVNLILIKPFGVLGAAIGTVSSEVVLAVYQILAARKDIKFKKFIEPLVYFTFSGIVMLSVLMFIPFSINSVMIRIVVKIVIGAVIYCSMTGIYFMKSHNETIELIRSFIFKKRKNI